jgi:hypothetical protein
MIESLARKGGGDLKTLEDHLNYSVVLIRRGKTDEAVGMLRQLDEEHQDDAIVKNADLVFGKMRFLVLSHCATAYFLATNADFKMNSVDYMEDSLKNWPKSWYDLSEEQKTYLTTLGWEETAFDRHRRYETYLLKLMKHRRHEERLKNKKQTVLVRVDPIFEDDPKKPIRFLNEAGTFEPGKIAKAEWEQLPNDAAEIVEQLLIWMPQDHRLLWLLGEVLNASAMGQQQKPAQDKAIKNALLVFKQLQSDSFGGQDYGRKEIEARFDALSKAVQDMPNQPDLDLNPWWRPLAVSFITGFAVGIFALWQYQELRRRRQARVTASH